jgi:hypothetical protein
MNAEQIRAEAIEVLARTRRARDLASWPLHEDGTPRDDWEAMTERRRQMYLDGVTPFVDALAAAGLLPTIVDEVETGVWGVDKPVRRRVRYLTEWRAVTE